MKSMVRRVREGLGRLPSWLAPPVAGAIILLLCMIKQIVVQFPLILYHGASPGDLLLAVGAAVGAGVVGGVGFSIVRPVLRRFGRTGDYLTGIACVDAYLGAILAASPYVFGRSGMPDDGRGWAILVALSTFFGLLVGRFWFGEPGASSEA